MRYKQCDIFVLAIKEFVTTSNNDKYREVHPKWKRAFPVTKELTTTELLKYFGNDNESLYDEDSSDTDSSDED